MTTRDPLRAHRRRARTRRFASVLLVGVPIAIAVGAIAWRATASDAAWAIAATGIVLAITVGVAMDVARRVDAAVIVRRLDARSARLEDSADLVGRDPATLNALERLQRDRVIAALAADARLDVRDPWPSRTIAAAVGIALVAVAAAQYWPTGPVTAARRPTAATDAAPRAPTVTRLVDASLHIAPPAYTGVAARDEPFGDAQAEEGATITWRVRVDPIPASLDLALHDGTRVPLARDGDAWQATKTLDANLLYGLRVPDGAPPLADAKRHRLAMIADRAPEVRVIAPDRTLTILEAGQPSWPLQFEASDDYGVADARLSITLAQGSGENIAVSERTITLRGEGDAKARRYRHALDLAALGFAQGDDVIVRLVVRDNRAPQPNESRSASFILRWPPPPATETTGMDGLVEKALPAYFRSQRQIIIDTEALIAQAPTLAPDDFVTRSDTIGVDQRTLRLRYGQFLGEEAESPKTLGEAHDHEAGEGEHDEVPGAAEAPAPQGFGGPVDELNTFGHAHDIAEAATLLDPKTREILRAALNAMWQAEQALRSGTPKAALPHEYEALRQIKLVQQAQRIYLARVGLELPAIDPARRLTGDRAGVRDRRDFLPDAVAADAVLAQAWQALSGDAVVDLDALAAWIARHEDAVPDPLALYDAIDRVRGEPACADCRRRLRDLLWSPLPPPATIVVPRARGDAVGDAYLDALGRER